MYEAKILADSIAHGVRLTTFQITFPRFILAEINTHRVLSRNSASSRAIPVEKRIKAVRENPFVPEAFGKNQKGMQSSELLDSNATNQSRELWLQAAEEACVLAEKLGGVGVHKQWANRLLEPFGWQTAIVSATEWDNFFALRAHPDAQPEFRKIAQMMRKALDENLPAKLTASQWHLPLIFAEDIAAAFAAGIAESNVDLYLAKVSTGRCARVSYLTHDGRRDLNADIALCERLGASGHLSPFEHPAMVSLQVPDEDTYRLTTRENEAMNSFIGNFRFPWIQYRKQIPGEDVFRGDE